MKKRKLAKRVERIQNDAFEARDVVLLQHGSHITSLQTRVRLLERQIEQLQEEVLVMQTVLGVQPQGEHHATVADRIASLEVSRIATLMRLWPRHGE